MNPYQKYLAITNSLRNAFCDLELVSTLTLADGTTQEISHTTRAVCKKAARKRNVSVLTFADIDRAALDNVFPFETFTVADFAELFVDHVGRRIPQGVGTVVKMPLTWIVKTGSWNYAGPKHSNNTLLAVYRGTQTGQGSLVDPGEYTTGTASGASTGMVVDTVIFTREQKDFQGSPYVIEADYLLSVPYASRVYVVNYITNTVSVIDANTNTVIATITGLSLPDYIAVNPDGTRLYATNVTGNNVKVIDTSNNTVIATIAVGNGPEGIAFNPAGTRAYCSNSGDNTVSVINTATNAVIATITVGNFPHGVRVNPAGTRVYVCNVFAGTVSVIDTSNNTVIATITVGGSPHQAAVNPAGTRVYAANYADSTVSVIDTSNNTVIATITGLTQPYGLAVNPVGTMIYVVNNVGNVSVINTATNGIVATIAVGASPESVAFDATGTHAFVSNAGTTTISVINTASNTVIATITVGTNPAGIAVSDVIGRTPSCEINRLLGLFGITTDATTFNAAIAADAAAGYLIDALYGGDMNGRTGKAIIEDLLRVARGWVSTTSTGAWSIIQDIAKASSLQCDSAADQIDISEYGDGDIQETVSIAYRPRASNGEDFTGKLSRITTGQTGEMQLKNPYIRSHTVADMLNCYWQKRLNSLRLAKASIHAVQIGNGDRITLTDYTNWNGDKDFIATGITRPGDKNDAILREYDASIYPYTAGTLPADATNTYSPDYSYTAPLAPSGLSVVSQGTGVDADGKVTAFALIRVTTPPAVNWARLMCVVTDTVTNEIYQAQLILNAGNYEAMVSGLRPNHSSNVVAWAVNANNIDGALTGAVTFTTATNSTVPSAPGSVTAVQYGAMSIRVAWAEVTGKNIRRYIIFKKVGSGSYAEAGRKDALYYTDENLAYGTTYTYKVQTEDNVGNTSADSSTAAVTLAANLGDANITTGGISGTSIANASINRGRSNTGTGSVSTGSLAVHAHINVALDVYAFCPAITIPNSQAATSFLVKAADSKAGATDSARFQIYNDDVFLGGFAGGVDIVYRTFTA